MSAADNVVDQVKSQVSDARARLAMLMGSALEGGWGPTFNVGDDGHSHGPFQINDLFHSDITSADAEDPAKAVAYMKGAYYGAVGQVPASLWSSNPELAAQQAAQLAERPKLPYDVSEGQAAVDQAYSRARNAVSGSGGSGWSFNPIHDIGKAAGDVGSAVKGGVGDVFGAAGNAAGDVVGGAFGAVWSDAKPFILTMAFAGLGLTLIALGGYQATKQRTGKAMQQLQVGAPSGGGGGGGKAASGEAGAGAAAGGIPPEAALAAA